MREIQSVGADQTSLWIAIRLDAYFQRFPRAIDAVPRRLRLIVDRFDVVVDNITSRVCESPCNIAIESDHHSGHAGESNTCNVELTGNDDVHLIPYRRQAEIEVRIAGK